MKLLKIQRIFDARKIFDFWTAVKNLSESFKADNPEIEWKEIAGMRDRLIHRYFSVDWDIVWEVINNRLPELKNIIKMA
ncbi:MAG: DUF86 domain-containing protein [Methanobacteriaceae archaeon]|nr:DUF86 domain-containing protein [Methanobacteriaceae archaeon]MDO9626011.1 DUF86 domain-containing protein [Methanobacteriaceae archaeon]